MLTRPKGYQRQGPRGGHGRAGRRAAGPDPAGRSGHRGTGGGAAPPRLAYRERMGKLLLIVLAVIVAFMVISLVISALHFLFFVGLVVLIVLGALRLTGGRRRRSRR